MFLKRVRVGFLASALSFAPAAAVAQNGLVQVPLGFCSMSSMSGATPINTSTCVIGSFTGTGNGTLLTVSSLTGAVTVGATVVSTGVPAGTTIVRQVSGLPGLAGVYQTSNPTTSSSASLTAGGVPLGATYAVFCAYVQGVVYRDDGAAPTGTAGSGGQGIAASSCLGYSGTLADIQFIQQSGGAVLGVTFYR